jgi:hypothetical protein
MMNWQTAIDKQMNYWLFKPEPRSSPSRREGEGQAGQWDGVRNIRATTEGDADRRFGFFIIRTGA